MGVGDAQAGFLLSTGIDPRLGVVFARSAATAEPMVPAAWNAMLCPATGRREPRKCALPDQPRAAGPPA
jgi:exosome complex RNA-binding protein Csl4